MLFGCVMLLFILFKVIIMFFQFFQMKESTWLSKITAHTYYLHNCSYMEYKLQDHYILPITYNNYSVINAISIVVLSLLLLMKPIPNKFYNLKIMQNNWHSMLILDVIISSSVVFHLLYRRQDTHNQVKKMGKQHHGMMSLCYLRIMRLHFCITHTTPCE